MAAKNIVLTHEGKKYTLEFNRRTIRTMERQGFAISKLEDMPMSMIPTLFAGAFMMHHRNMSEQLLDAIYDTIEDKEGFLSKLSEMYADPVIALMDEPEKSEGNTKWEASW